MAVLELEARSGQIRQATADLQRLESQGGKTENRVLSLGRAFAALGGAAILGVAIKNTADFSQAIADLSAITGAAGKDLEFYRQQAAEIGRTTTLSASQAAEAFKLIASAQPQLLKNAEALAQVTKEAVALAEATGATLPDAARALGSSLNQFGLDASKASEVINILAASSQLGTAEVTSVTEALRNAGSAANSLGLDLAETVAGIQALAASGRQGSDAGTALRQVLLRLESTGRRDLQPSIVGLNGALNNLAKENLNNIQLMELFGQEAFTAATSLLAQRGVVSELNVTLRGTSTAYEQAATRVNTFSGDLKGLNSAIEALQIKVFSDAVDGLGRSFVQAATGGVNALSENLDTIASAAQFAAAVLAGRLIVSLGATGIAFIGAQASAIRLVFALNSTTTASTGAAVGLTALNVAATAATRAFVLLGGPVGVIVLTAAAIATFGTGVEFAKPKVIELANELDRLKNSFAGLTEEQLRNEYAQQAAKAFVTLPADIQRTEQALANAREEYSRLQKQQANQGILSGFNSPEQRAARENIKKIQDQLEKLGDELNLSEAAVAELGTMLANLPSSANAAGSAIEGLGGKAGLATDKFYSLSQSLVAQIIELRDGANAAEEYALGLQLGADATDVQRAAAESLLSTLQQLRAEREAERAAEDEKREKSAFQDKERGAADKFGDLSAQLEDPAAAQLEQQLQARLAIIDEYRMTSQANQAAADQLEIAAFEDVERQKTEIAQRESEARKQTQLQQIDATASFFGDVASLAQNAGKEQFGIYKAAAIAQAVIGTYSSAVKAYDSLASIPIVGPALGAAAAGAAVAFGLQQVAAIKAQKPAGRALGGSVYGSTPYMVGERGPELFTPQQSGNITPFNQLMDTARAGSKVDVMVNVQNYGGGEVQVRDRGFDQRQQKQIIDIVVGEYRPGGRVHRAAIATTTANNRTA